MNKGTFVDDAEGALSDRMPHVKLLGRNLRDTMLLQRQVASPRPFDGVVILVVLVALLLLVPHPRSIGKICRKFMGTFTNSGCPQNFNSNVLSRAIAGVSGLIFRKRLQKVHADLQKVHANLQEIHKDLQKIHADLQINNHGNAD